MSKALALTLILMLLCANALAEAAPDTSRVADASEMTASEDIVPEGMVPVTADLLNDGVYEVKVDSSSSMFKVVGCDLTVKDGQITALLYMKSDAYSYMYPGTAEAASRAPLSDLSALQALDDGWVFVLPVDALNAGCTCAAFSARKQAWYPRTLLFRADSLPLSAWRNLVTAESLNLADGDYDLDVTLTGGSMTLQSPAVVHVAGGVCTADIVFSTARIDYVIVDGVRYEPAAAEGGAVFTVPVAAFDVGLSIIVDSTAMIPAVEIPCTMTFAAPAA